MPLRNVKYPFGSPAHPDDHVQTRSVFLYVGDAPEAVDQRTTPADGELVDFGPREIGVGQEVRFVHQDANDRDKWSDPVEVRVTPITQTDRPRTPEAGTPIFEEVAQEETPGPAAVAPPAGGARRVR